MPRTRARRTAHDGVEFMARGVYKPRCLTHDGFPYLFAITSDGRKPFPDRPIFPFECECDVIAEVEADLNRIDPLP